MKRRLIIHIGTEKTGSSSIQEYLFENDAKLRAQGIYALKSGGAPNNRGIVTYCLNPAVEDDHIADMGLSNPIAREAWRARTKSELLLELNNIPADAHSVVLSSEHFQSRLTSKEELISLQGLFFGYFEDIQIFVYLRRQDEVAVSLFSTQCRTGDSVDEIFPAWGTEGSHYFNYQKLLTLWSSVFGASAINVMLYEDAKRQSGGVIACFFQALLPNYVDADLGKFPAHNSALSAISQHVLSDFNNIFPRYDSSGVFREIWAKWRMELEVRLQERFHGPGILPSQMEAIDFTTRFDASNNEVAETWFSRARLFSDDFSKYPESRTPVPAEAEIAKIIFQIFRSDIN